MLKKIIPLSILAMGLLSCENNEVSEEQLVEIATPEPLFKSFQNFSQTVSIPNKDKNGKRLAQSDEYLVGVYSAEFITADGSEEMGNIVFFNNVGNKQLGADFVPGLALDGTDAISYYVDNTRPSSDLNVDVTNDAIDRAMSTWNNVGCSDLGIFERPFDGTSTGLVAAQVGSRSEVDYGGSRSYVADVNHAGWLPGTFFDFISPNGSQSILGVAFTITFRDQNGNNVDLDNNNKADVAWREIYYNDTFRWNDGNTYDVETIALHEAGHGLSQAHFGKAFVSGIAGKGNVKLHFSPRAVMNASYSGVQTEIEKTDKAGHCSNWSSWNNN